ncbi:hypothetical protein C8F04DRAFT_1396291, partial [Mycena alexandri]
MGLCPHATESADESFRRVGLRQELVQEGRSALANLVFIHIISLTLVPVHPELRPIMLTYQHNQFDLNFVKSKSALFFEEGQQLVAEWNDCDSGNVTPLHVLGTALREVKLATKGRVLAVKACGIVSLAALASLHTVLAPFHAVARQKLRNIVDAIASITRTLSTGTMRLATSLRFAGKLLLEIFRNNYRLKNGGDNSKGRNRPNSYDLSILADDHTSAGDASIEVNIYNRGWKMIRLFIRCSALLSGSEPAARLHFRSFLLPPYHPYHTMSSTSLNVILGAVVFTGILGALFFGAASIQTYNYYHTYRSDGIVLKAAVAALWAVDALHIGIYTYTIWYYVVEAFYTAWMPQ